LQLLEEVLSSCLVPNDVTYAAAVSACRKSQQWAIAARLLMKAPRSESTSLIIAAVNVCAEGQQWQEALLLWKQALCLSASPALCNEIVGLCSKVGRSSQAMHLMTDMQIWSVEPNMTTFIAVLNVSERAGRFPSMLRLLDRMSSLCLSLLHARRGVWSFPDSQFNYPGHAVMALDTLHERQCLRRKLELAYHCCMYGSIMARLCCLRTTIVAERSHSAVPSPQAAMLARRSSRLHDRVLEQQFSLGSLFAAHALQDLGFIAPHLLGNASLRKTSGMKLNMT